MTPLCFAEISDSMPWFILACVLVAIVAMVGLGIILKFLKELRTNIAEELKREISSAREPAPMAVQQPLVVTPHAAPISHAQVEQMDKEVHGRISRERKEIDVRAAKLEQSLAELDTALDEQTREINDRIDKIPGRTIELLNATKQLHAGAKNS